MSSALIHHFPVNLPLPFECSCNHCEQGQEVTAGTVEDVFTLYCLGHSLSETKMSSV